MDSGTRAETWSNEFVTTLDGGFSNVIMGATVSSVIKLVVQSTVPRMVRKPK